MPENSSASSSAASGRQSSLFKRVAHALAHDVRAPVLTIDGYSRILLESQKNPENIQLTERIGSGVKTLQARLSAVIDLCRIAGTDPALVAVSLDDLVRRVIQARCASETTPIETDIGVMPVVQADPVLIENALLRLVDNAVIASAAASPRQIGVTCIREGSHWVIRVRNTGPEIAEVARRRLFEPFGIAHAGGVTSVGMGLAIVREIAELHGGKAWHEAVSGGSVFAFSIAADPATTGGGQ